MDRKRILSFSILAALICGTLYFLLRQQPISTLAQVLQYQTYFLSFSSCFLIRKARPASQAACFCAAESQACVQQLCYIGELFFLFSHCGVAIASSFVSSSRNRANLQSFKRSL